MKRKRYIFKENIVDRLSAERVLRDLRNICDEGKHDCYIIINNNYAIDNNYANSFKFNDVTCKYYPNINQLGDAWIYSLSHKSDLSDMMQVTMSSDYINDNLANIMIIY